jgi:hypothetical protein
MDMEAIREARERAQNALNRAALTEDPQRRMEWHQIAEAWLARLAELEERPSPRGPLRLVA